MSRGISKIVKVVGRVQGVGFRAATYRKALSIGAIQGWVKNLPEGDVEVRLQAAEDAGRAMLVWLNKGPPLAIVERLEVLDLDWDENLGPFVIQS